MEYNEVEALLRQWSHSIPAVIPNFCDFQEKVRGVIQCVRLPANIQSNILTNYLEEKAVLKYYEYCT